LTLPVIVDVVIKNATERSILDMPVKDMNGGSFSLYVASKRLNINNIQLIIQTKNWRTAI